MYVKERKKTLQGKTFHLCKVPESITEEEIREWQEKKKIGRRTDTDKKKIINGNKYIRQFYLSMHDLKEGRERLGEEGRSRESGGRVISFVNVESKEKKKKRIIQSYMQVCDDKERE